MYGATKRKFSDLNFQEVDLDDPSTRYLCEKYNIHGIPHVVFLDGSGNVLYNGLPMAGEEGFTYQINQYH